MELEGNGSLLAPVTADANRLRLAAEGSHERRLESGPLLRPSVELGLRHDGGDGEAGLGVKLGGGLDYTGGRLTAGLDARTLLAHEGGVEEWGVSGSLGLAPGRAGRGLSFALRSSWGEAGSGMDRLWSQGLTARETEDRDDIPAALRLDSELGYGLGLRAGLLTPYGGFGMSNDRRELRLGARYALGERVGMNLEGYRHEGGAADTGVRLRAAIRF